MTLAQDAPVKEARTPYLSFMVAEHGRTGEKPASDEEAVAGVEQKDAQQTTYVREYVVKVGEELPEIGDGILGLMDEDLVLSVGSGEPKALCSKKKGDDHPYLAEFAPSDTKSEAVEDARPAHAEATKVTERVVVVTHLIRLSLRLNASVFQSEVLQNLDEAGKKARATVQERIRSASLKSSWTSLFHK